MLVLLAFFVAGILVDRFGLVDKLLNKFKKSEPPTTPPTA